MRLPGLGKKPRDRILRQLLTKLQGRALPPEQSVVFEEIQSHPDEYAGTAASLWRSREVDGDLDRLWLELYRFVRSNLSAVATQSAVDPRTSCGKDALVHEEKHLLLFGGPMTGKSHVAQSLCKDAALTERFHSIHYIETGPNGSLPLTEDQVLFSILAKLGISGAVSAQDAVVSLLSRTESLLVLDDLSSMRSRPKRDLLARLQSGPALLVVDRTKMQWIAESDDWRACEVPPLDLGSVQQLLSSELDGPFTPDLVRQVYEVSGGYPNVVDALISIIDEFPDRAAAMLDSPGRNLAGTFSVFGRLLDAIVPEGRERLCSELAPLAWCPSGLPEHEVSFRWQVNMDSAEWLALVGARLTQVEEVYGTTWVRLIEPLRHYLISVLKTPSEELRQHYCDRALSLELGYGGPLTVLPWEFRNYLSVLAPSDALKSSAREQAARAALVRWSRRQGVDLRAWIPAAYLDSGDPIPTLLAGDLALVDGQTAEAEERFWALAQASQDPVQSATASKRLGDTCFNKWDLAGASAHYEDARASYLQAQEPLGEAAAILCLAEIQLRNGELKDALANVALAESGFRDMRNELGLANSRFLRLELALLEAELSGGRGVTELGAEYYACRRMYEESGSVLGVMNCQVRILETEISSRVRAFGGEAMSALAPDANELVDQADVLGITLAKAHACELLGRVETRRDEADAALHASREYYARAGDLLGLAWSGQERDCLDGILQDPLLEQVPTFSPTRLRSLCRTRSFIMFNSIPVLTIDG